MTTCLPENLSDHGLLILGMHRSGTSCLAGMLACAGFASGKVSEWNPDNRKGNQENIALSKLNRAWLSQFGWTWDAPNRVTGQETSDLERLLVQEFRPGQPWMFKDPTTLWVLEQWVRVLPDIGMIGIFRAPQAVAKSLEARSGMAIRKGVENWVRYNMMLLDALNERDFPLVRFTKDSVAFTGTVKRLLQKLTPELIESGAVDIARLADFFDSTLVHQPDEGSGQLADFARQQGVPEKLIVEMEETWSRLNALAMNPEPEQPLGGSRKPEVGDEQQVSQLVDAGCHEAAITLLYSWVERQPDRSDLWQQGLRTLRGFGTYETLERWVEKGLISLPEDPYLLYESARFRWQAGRYHEALDCAERAMDHAPGWIPPAQLLANWYYELHLWRRSADLFRTLQREQPDVMIQALFTQIFYDIGDGFCERHSTRIPLNPRSSRQEFLFEYLPLGKALRLRLDPVNVRAVIESPTVKFILADGTDIDVEISSSNATQKVGEIYVFDTPDSRLMLNDLQKQDSVPEAIRFSFDVLHTGWISPRLCDRLISCPEPVGS